MNERIIEGKDNWVKEDERAWNIAAETLRDDGWIQIPDEYRNAIFHKDGNDVALVRNLGILNWHPVAIKPNGPGNGANHPRSYIQNPVERFR